MSIVWKYLDKRAAAIEALKDYPSMRFILENTDQNIAAEQDKMTGIGSPNLDGMPHAHNPQAGEDRLIEGIEKIDVLKERYRQAVEYMQWFKPAWEELSEEEQFILENFYLSGNEYGNGTADYVADRFHIERSSVYNKKNRALKHLTVLLYGKE